MVTRPHIVYATYDGLLEPLGYSQVVRVVSQIADGGQVRFTICSLEKEKDRNDADREQKLEAQLRRRHIRWRRRTWTDGGGPLDVARNLRSLISMLDSVVAEDGADLFHARSYMPAAAARHVGLRQGVDYLFDTRGFWVDERLENGRFIGGPVGERAARSWETKLYNDAAAAVMLTELGADDIEHNPQFDWPRQRPVEVIPTLVDYDAFALAPNPGPTTLDGVDVTRLNQSLVIGWVGSVKPVYPLDESLRLFDLLYARRNDAHLVCLTRNQAPVLRKLEQLRLPPTSYTVTTAEHRDMPRWLQLMDWGLLLRSTRPEQRAYLAAMPTKLGEFFATGTRPIYCGASSEVRDWIQRAGTGVVLDDYDEQSLRAAADCIADTEPNPRRLWEARWRTRSHFGLEGGTDRYHRLYRRVLNRSDDPRLKVLFITEGTTVPASRFRVHQFVPHLRDRGIECTIRAGYGDGYNQWASTPAAPVYKLACSLRRIPYCLDADRFDVVFLQRPALPFTAAAEKLANWRNPHTIFDVDDAVFLHPDGSPNDRQHQAFRQIVARCAHVICGNEYLAEHTRDLSPTTVIPTVIDTERYQPGCDDGADDGVTIGWMGTASNFRSLNMIAPALRRLAQHNDDVEIRLISNERFEPLDGIDNVHQTPWDPDREVDQLQQFDIGLMPLVDTAGSRGKCGFKAIQYMAVQLPVIASAVGVNTDIVTEQTGILVDDAAEFGDAIEQLVGDAGLRRRMGKAGRRRVCRHYSVNAVIDRYVELFEAVARRRPEDYGRPQQLSGDLPPAGRVAE